MTTTAVIPTYNEGERIVSVIKAARSCPEITQIVVVDDGSDDSSRQVVSKITGCEIVYLVKNYGKSFAIQKGVAKSSGDLILLLDADLQGLTAKHLTCMVRTAIDLDSDMVLAKRGKPHFLSGLSGFSEAYTGERIVKKSFFNKHPAVLQQEGFLIEPAINKLLFKPEKKVFKVLFPEVSSTHKISKHGFIIGIMKDVNLIMSYLQYLGVRGFLQQLSWVKQIETVSCSTNYN